MWENIGGMKRKKKGRSSFSSSLNTHETFGACSLVAVAWLSHLIVNAATGCCSLGQALALNAVIAASFCTMFQQRKKVSVMIVLKDSTCLLLELSVMVKSLTSVAVPINGSGYRQTVAVLVWSEVWKAGGTFSKLCKCMFVFGCCVAPNSDIIINVMNEVTLLKKKISWAGSQHLWRDKERMLSWCYSYLYIHKNYLRIAIDCMDFNRGMGGGGCPFEAIDMPDTKLDSDLYERGSMRLGSNMRVGNKRLVAWGWVVWGWVAWHDTDRQAAATCCNYDMSVNCH